MRREHRHVTVAAHGYSGCFSQQAEEEIQGTTVIVDIVFWERLFA